MKAQVTYFIILPVCSCFLFTNSMWTHSYCSNHKSPKLAVGCLWLSSSFVHHLTIYAAPIYLWTVWCLGRVWVSPTLVSWIAIFHIILSGVRHSVYSCHCNLRDNNGLHVECKIFMHTIWFFWQPASFVPRLSPQKRGGESLITPWEKLSTFGTSSFLWSM